LIQLHSEKKERVDNESEKEMGCRCARERAEVCGGER